MEVSRAAAFLAIVSAVLLFGLFFPLSSLAGGRIHREFAGTYLWDGAPPGTFSFDYEGSRVSAD